jgi:putative membrane protein
MQAAESRPKRHLRLHFRLRPLLLRWLVSALCLAFTVIVVPHVYFTGSYRILSWLIISAVFGLLMAFVKPLVQLLLLPLIFVSYGLIVVLINTIIIWLLALIFPNRFQVDHLIWALVAGLVSGLLVTLLDDVFGLSPPIIQGGPDALRERMARARPGYREGELLDAAETGKQKLQEITARPEQDGHDREDGELP